MAFSGRDIIGIILSFILAFGMIGLAEVGRRLWGLPRQVTRKAIHIAAGMWVFVIIAIFDHWWAGIIPPAAFIFLNYLFYRRQVFQAMDAHEEGPGTVYFAFSVALLLGLFWSQGQASLAAAGFMPLVWGDALAALWGTHLGRHRYSVLGYQRSWEGSLVMFLGSLVATWLALLYFGLVTSSLTYALIVAGAATVAEAISPKGIDNLTVPFLSCGLLYLLWSGG